MSFAGLVWWCSGVVFSMPLGALFLEPPGRVSNVGHGQPLLVLGLRLCSRSYKVICGWLVPVLGSEVLGRQSCKLRLAALCARLGILWWAPPLCKLRPVATYTGFVVT